MVFGVIWCDGLTSYISILLFLKISDQQYGTVSGVHCYIISYCYSFNFLEERHQVRHNFNKALCPLSFNPVCPLSSDESWRLIQNQDLRHQTAPSLSSITTTVWPSVEHCLTPRDHLQPAMCPCPLKPTRSE